MSQMSAQRAHYEREANALITNTVVLHSPTSNPQDRRRADAWMRQWLEQTSVTYTCICALEHIHKLPETHEYRTHPAVVGTICSALRNKAKSDWQLSKHLETLMTIAPSFCQNRPAMKCISSAICMAYLNKKEAPIEVLIGELQRDISSPTAMCALYVLGSFPVDTKESRTIATHKQEMIRKLVSRAVQVLSTFEAIIKQLPQTRDIILECAGPWIDVCEAKALANTQISELIRASRQSGDRGSEFMEILVSKSVTLDLTDPLFVPFVRSLLDQVTATANTSEHDNFLRMRLLLTALESWAQDKQTLENIIDTILHDGLRNVKVCGLSINYLVALKKYSGGNLYRGGELIARLRLFSRIPNLDSMSEDDMDEFFSYRNDLRAGLRDLATSSEESQHLVQQALQTMNSSQNWVEIEETFHLLSAISKNIIGKSIPALSIAIVDLVKKGLEMKQVVWHNRVLCSTFLLMASQFLPILIEEDDIDIFAKLLELCVVSLTIHPVRLTDEMMNDKNGVIQRNMKAQLSEAALSQNFDLSKWDFRSRQDHTGATVLLKMCQDKNVASQYLIKNETLMKALLPILLEFIENGLYKDPQNCTIELNSLNVLSQALGHIASYSGPLGRDIIVKHFQITVGYMQGGLEQEVKANEQAGGSSSSSSRPLKKTLNYAIGSTGKTSVVNALLNHLSTCVKHAGCVMTKGKKKDEVPSGWSTPASTNSSGSRLSSSEIPELPGEQLQVLASNSVTIRQCLIDGHFLDMITHERFVRCFPTSLEFLDELLIALGKIPNLFGVCLRFCHELSQYPVYYKVTLEMISSMFRNCRVNTNIVVQSLADESQSSIVEAQTQIESELRNLVGGILQNVVTSLQGEVKNKILHLVLPTSFFQGFFEQLNLVGATAEQITELQFRRQRTGDEAWKNSPVCRNEQWGPIQNYIQNIKTAGETNGANGTISMSSEKAIADAMLSKSNEAPVDDGAEGFKLNAVQEEVHQRTLDVVLSTIQCCKSAFPLLADAELSAALILMLAVLATKTVEKTVPDTNEDKKEKRKSISPSRAIGAHTKNAGFFPAKQVLDFLDMAMTENPQKMSALLQSFNVDALIQERCGLAINERQKLKQLFVQEAVVQNQWVDMGTMNTLAQRVENMYQYQPNVSVGMLLLRGLLKGISDNVPSQNHGEIMNTVILLRKLDCFGHLMQGAVLFAEFPKPGLQDTVRERFLQDITSPTADVNQQFVKTTLKKFCSRRAQQEETQSGGGFLGELKNISRTPDRGLTGQMTELSGQKREHGLMS